MHQRFVFVEMRVRFAPVPGEVVLVLMVLVVDVGVCVGKRLVLVPVRVALSEVQPNTNHHEPGRRPEQRPRCFAQQDQGKRHANEGRGRKIRAGARAAQVSQCQHEQHEAHAVAEQTYDACGDRRRRAREGMAHRERDAGIGNPRDQTFESGNLHRIAGGDLAREVVVDRPGEAGAGDGDRPERGARAGVGGLGERYASRDDQRHAERDAPVEVFLEREPGESRREHAFEIEQERGIGRRQMCETQHQQHRASYAASKDRTREPRKITARERGLVRAGMGVPSPPRPPCEQPDTGTEVQQPREQHRRHRAHQQFSERRARAEKRGGGKGFSNTGAGDRRGHGAIITDRAS